MSKVTFTCSECKTKNQVESNDFDVWEEKDIREMGVSTEYWTKIETQCENLECTNHVEIIFFQTEYPVGFWVPSSISEFSGVEDNIDIETTV